MSYTHFASYAHEFRRKAPVASTTWGEQRNFGSLAAFQNLPRQFHYIWTLGGLNLTKITESIPNLHGTRVDIAKYLLTGDCLWKKGNLSRYIVCLPYQQFET
jgi:hypothetical protein